MNVAPQVRFDLIPEESRLVLPGARSDCRFEIAGKYSKELGEGQDSDISLGFKPSLPFFCFFLRFEATFSSAFWHAVRIFESTRRNLAVPGLIFVDAYLFPSFKLVLR